MSTGIKIYKVQRNQGRIALGDLVAPGDMYTAIKRVDGTIILTRVVLTPAPAADQ